MFIFKSIIVVIALLIGSISALAQHSTISAHAQKSSICPLDMIQPPHADKTIALKNRIENLIRYNLHNSLITVDSQVYNPTRFACEMTYFEQYYYQFKSDASYCRRPINLLHFMRSLGLKTLVAGADGNGIINFFEMLIAHIGADDVRMVDMKNFKLDGFGLIDFRAILKLAKQINFINSKNDFQIIINTNCIIKDCTIPFKNFDGLMSGFTPNNMKAGSQIIFRINAETTQTAIRESFKQTYKESSFKGELLNMDEMNFLMNSDYMLNGVHTANPYNGWVSPSTVMIQLSGVTITGKSFKILPTTVIPEIIYSLSSPFPNFLGLSPTFAKLKAKTIRFEKTVLTMGLETIY
ncbi:MAG: hypothetical protein SGI74_00015 [Oligoflexia bacterium]|nr:hypothetical protein [Oligoflexia bacterium]